MTPSNIPSPEAFRALDKGKIRIAVIGYGLMGAPLGKALMDLGYYVTACVRSDKDERIIHEKNLASKVVKDPAEAIKNANIVFMCTHVGVMEEILKSALENLSNKDLENLWFITDMGSTKQPVHEIFERVLTPRNIRFVLAHPIVGHHTKGLTGGLERIEATKMAGKKSMYEGCVTVLTPLNAEDANRYEYQIVKEIYGELGSEVIYLENLWWHDNFLADTSHAIHCNSVISVTCLDEDTKKLIKKTRKSPNASSLFKVFDESIRVARGDPAMWTDICCRENPLSVKMRLVDWRRTLERLKPEVLQRRGPALENFVGENKRSRETLLNQASSMTSSEFFTRVKSCNLSEDERQYLILTVHDEPIVAQAAYIEAMRDFYPLIGESDPLSKFCGTGFRSTTMPLTNELSPYSQKNPNDLWPFLRERIKQIEYACNLIEQSRCAEFQKWLERAKETADALLRP